MTELTELKDLEDLLKLYGIGRYWYSSDNEAVSYQLKFLFDHVSKVNHNEFKSTET